MTTLSVIIVSYNTKKLLERVVKKLFENLRSATFSWELIIVDNASFDGTINYLEELASKSSNVKVFFNKKNLGFSKANNQALTMASGKYVLFLNSDVILGKVNFQNLFNFLESDSKKAGLTIKLNLRNGELDWACHRGIPTPWRAFSYLSGFEKIFGKVPILKNIFGGYHLCSRNLSSIHEIEIPSCAFFLVKRKVLDDVGFFDENFFMYGEDVDLAYRIIKKGYSIYFYPKYQAVHLKYQSGLVKEDEKIKSQTRIAFYEAMEIFYRKHYRRNLFGLFYYFVLFFVWLKKRKK